MCAPSGSSSSVVGFSSRLVGLQRGAAGAEFQGLAPRVLELRACVGVVSRYLSNHTQPTSTDAEDVVSRYLSNHAQPTSTDAEDVVSRYLLNHAQPTSTDAEDVVSRYLLNQSQPLVAAQPSANGSGFGWADAGIGAGGMLGIMLLVGAAALVMRQSRRHLTSA